MTDMAKNENDERMLKRWSSWSYAPILMLILCGLVVYAGWDGGEVGNLKAPGPHLWPLAVTIATGTVAVALLVRPNREGIEATTVRGAVRVGLTTGAISAFCILFELMGFIVPCFLFLIFMVRGMGKQTWGVTFATAIPGSLLTYAGFVYVIGVPITGFGL